jgi:trigger factor
VDDAELSYFVTRQAEQMGMQPEVLARQLAEAGQIGAAAAEVLRGKAVARLTERVSLQDEAGNELSYATLIGADEAEAEAAEVVAEAEVDVAEAAEEEAAEEEAAEAEVVAEADEIVADAPADAAAVAADDTAGDDTAGDDGKAKAKTPAKGRSRAKTTSKKP